MKSKQFKKLIEDNLDYLINEWQRADVNQFGYNGFTCSKQDKIKQLIYNSMTLKVSYDIFEKLKLSKYFGNKYTDKLFEIFIKRNDYDLFQFLFVESLIDEPEPKINSLLDIKNGIDKVLASIEFTTNQSIYQSFYFKNEICKKVDKLAKVIQEIIGDENCEFDGNESGHLFFSLYWNISIIKYDEIMKKIADWANEKELLDLICFEIEKDDTEKEIVGNAKILKEYYGR